MTFVIREIWKTVLSYFRAIICWFSDVVNRVRNGESIPVRPLILDAAASDIGRPIVEMIRACWDEIPKQRPTFKHVRRVISQHGGAKYTTTYLS